MWSIPTFACPIGNPRLFSSWRTDTRAKTHLDARVIVGLFPWSHGHQQEHHVENPRLTVFIIVIFHCVLHIIPPQRIAKTKWSTPDYPASAQLNRMRNIGTGASLKALLQTFYNSLKQIFHGTWDRLGTAQLLRNIPKSPHLCGHRETNTWFLSTSCGSIVFLPWVLQANSKVKVLHAKASELQAKGDLVEALHYYQRCHWSSYICWWDGETNWKTYALLLRFLLSMGWTEVCWDKIQLIMPGVSWWAPETFLFNLFICNWCSRTSTAIILKWTRLMVGVWLSGR